MNMKAMAVVRKDGAGGLGHVGWSFHYDNNTAICGATENPLGTPHTSAFEKGAWHKRLIFNAVVPEFRTERMLVGKRVPAYDSFKIIEVQAANPQAAWNAVCWCAQQDYWATGMSGGRNCMDDAYDILCSFGCLHLPTPQNNWKPNDWFNNIPAPEQSLYAIRASDAVAEAIPEPFSLPVITPAQPVWRREGTPEHTALMQRIAAGQK